MEGGSSSLTLKKTLGMENTIGNQVDIESVQCLLMVGHLLGEYSALASIADVLPVSSLVDVVFYRGITMQCAVEQDSENRSNYAMCVVNPSRISKTFTDAALREVVDSIAVRTGTLLEIVNYNVEVRSRSVFHLLF